MSEKLLRAVSSATVRIMGMDLTVHVLEDGQRVIDAESVERFFEALGGDIQPTEEELFAAAKMIKGVK